MPLEELVGKRDAVESYRAGGLAIEGIKSQSRN